jgi:hypothetical protein
MANSCLFAGLPVPRNIQLVAVDVIPAQTGDAGFKKKNR